MDELNFFRIVTGLLIILNLLNILRIKNLKKYLAFYKQKDFNNFVKDRLYGED